MCMQHHSEKLCDQEKAVQHQIYTSTTEKSSRTFTVYQTPVWFEKYWRRLLCFKWPNACTENLQIKTFIIFFFFFTFNCINNVCFNLTLKKKQKKNSNPTKTICCFLNVTFRKLSVIYLQSTTRFYSLVLDVLMTQSATSCRYQVLVTSQSSHARSSTYCVYCI